MTTTIAVLVALTVVTLVVLAVVVVLVVDRVHATVQHLLAVRDDLVPLAAALREDAERARRHAQRVQQEARELRTPADDR